MEDYLEAYAAEIRLSDLVAGASESARVCPSELPMPFYAGLRTEVFLHQPGSDVLLLPEAVGMGADVAAWELYSWGIVDGLEVDHLASDGVAGQNPWLEADDWSFMGSFPVGEALRVEVPPVDEELAARCDDRASWVTDLTTPTDVAFPPRGCMRTRPVLVRALDEDGATLTSVGATLVFSLSDYDFPFTPLQSLAPRMTVERLDEGMQLHLELELPEDVAQSARAQASGSTTVIFGTTSFFPESGVLARDFRAAAAEVTVASGLSRSEVGVLFDEVPTEVVVRHASYRHAASSAGLDEGIWRFKLVEAPSGDITAQLVPPVPLTP